MTVRELRESDIPVLSQIASDSGFPYCDLHGPLTEAVLVVADEEDRPVIAVVAERIVQMYALMNPASRPETKALALRMVHPAMAAELRKLGYSEANCALPPQIEKSFGGRLQKSFGWVRQWPVWAIRF